MSERWIGDVRADYFLTPGGETAAEAGRSVERTVGGALRLYDGAPIRIEIPDSLLRFLSTTDSATTT